MKIVLGSQSEARKKVLLRAGYEFDVVVAGIDEKEIRDPDPEKLTLALARAKAKAILPKIKEPSLLITSDQVVTFNGTMREKPENVGEAFQFLFTSHLHPSSTVTAVVVTNTKTGERFVGVDVATIWFRPFTLQVIMDYIKTGDPFRLAGGFDHEHPLLAPFIKKIDGEKESILGLPISLTEKLLDYAIMRTCLEV
ncbi:MAG TPA: Maf family nucleotide pyrophosphatase [Candidatus Paceibacterota bacterium]|nr:Maf family nucleotide pyrophosphatase [Candidatus Paceibacterota bacterium]